MATGWVRKAPARPLPPDWDKRKLAVRHRAGHRCEHIMQHSLERCPERGIDVDHIVERSDGGSDSFSNLQLLCDWHHKQKTGSHAGRKSWKLRQERAAAAARRHPGVLE